MKNKIDGDDFLKHMMFWSNQTDTDCINIATTKGVLDAKEALLNMFEKDLAIEFQKEVITDLRNY